MKSVKSEAPLSICELVELAKKQLTEVTGLKQPEVVAVSHADDGWHVRIEMLELVRIPSSADVIGEYTVRLKDDGSLIEFYRKRSRLRAQTVEEEEAA